MKKIILQKSCLLHLLNNLLKIHGFWNPSQKLHEFRGTHGTQANAATAIEMILLEMTN